MGKTRKRNLHLQLGSTTSTLKAKKKLRLSKHLHRARPRVRTSFHINALTSKEFTRQTRAIWSSRQCVWPYNVHGSFYCPFPQEIHHQQRCNPSNSFLQRIAALLGSTFSIPDNARSFAPLRLIWQDDAARCKIHSVPKVPYSVPSNSSWSWLYFSRLPTSSSAEQTYTMRRKIIPELGYWSSYKCTEKRIRLQFAEKEPKTVVHAPWFRAADSFVAKTEAGNCNVGWCIRRANVERGEGHCRPLICWRLEICPCWP